MDAPAKINLYLHVTGRREDGFHLLDGLVAFADIADGLEIAPAAHFSFRAMGPFADKVPADNSVTQAAKRLARELGISPQVAIALTKNLPVAAGIGGGSADAAAALRILSGLWKSTLSRKTMDALALSLGSDVPVCFAGKAAYIRDIGEKITPVATLPALSILLVNPGVEVSSQAVYRMGVEKPSGEAKKPGKFYDAEALITFLKTTRNDLTSGAMHIAPEIEGVLSALEGTKGCALARMSGSGATCFGLFTDGTKAEQAAERIATDHRDWWVRLGRLV